MNSIHPPTELTWKESISPIQPCLRCVNAGIGKSDIRVEFYAPRNFTIIIILNGLLQAPWNQSMIHPARIEQISTQVCL